MRAPLLALAALAITGAASAAPVPGAALPKGHYGELEKLPDWGGAWVLAPSPNAPPVAKGDYARKLAQRKAFADANNGEYPRDFSYCAPPGVTYQMALTQYPIEFLFNPGRVTILLESWMQVRRVFTDGRTHPPDLEESLNGHSIGHWEGDTLVVDTVGLKPQARIVVGLEHSDKERIVERIHLDPKDPDTLVDEMTVIDPEALEKPWLNVLRYKRHRDWDLIEYVCTENDLNPVGADGKGVFAPPPAGK